MYKYLYGKWDVLKGLVEGNASIRFCDIRHYARLENDNMRDDEAFKKFEFSPDSIKLNFAGIDLPPEDISSNIKFRIPTRHCLCICLSNKKNDEELFEKFNADVCIEFNVEYLIEFMRFLFEEKFGGEVIAKNVTYYTDNAGVSFLPDNEAVFTKHSRYQHEDEFRIAAFLPYDEKTVIHHGDKKIEPFKSCNCSEDDISQGNCKCYFAFFHNGLPDGFKSYVGEVFKKN
ncbi:hypothetical protein [Salinivibrio kushneri]|uniref:Uncharacterized protein n=1 Tax=Salinivibrio kushneri TaxID=1908198 RepID=A0AB36JT09_9GAMM|nr:hypothetical protein [Salinivibrio kushneri]OOE38872.1 hypothetical protein BZG09_17075 [Salinivibrio kushneri]